LLWLRHVLDAEADTRGMPRAVLDWSRFLDDWPASLQRVAEQLGLGWMRGDGWKCAEVTDFLSPELLRPGRHENRRILIVGKKETMASPCPSVRADQ
jgi:hypothetical protein